VYLVQRADATVFTVLSSVFLPLLHDFPYLFFLICLW
jgi:hypothetical protein